jgi:hypothetical protein
MENERRNEKNDYFIIVFKTLSLKNHKNISS